MPLKFIETYIVLGKAIIIPYLKPQHLAYCQQL
jgi:hypothetical protein